MREIFIGTIDNGKFSSICAQTDPELFYPEKGSGMGSRDAKSICIRSCATSHRDECLEGALDRKEPYGVWGGRSTAERNKILGKRAKDAS